MKLKRVILFSLRLFIAIAYILFIYAVCIISLIAWIAYFSKHQVYGNVYIRGNISTNNATADLIYKNKKIGTLDINDYWTIIYPYMLGRVSLTNSNIQHIQSKKTLINFHGKNALDGRYFYIFDCINDSFEIFETAHDFIDAYASRGLRTASMHDDIGSILNEGEPWFDPRDFTPTCQYVPYKTGDYDIIFVIAPGMAVIH